MLLTFFHTTFSLKLKDPTWSASLRGVLGSVNFIIFNLAKKSTFWSDFLHFLCNFLLFWVTSQFLQKLPIRPIKQILRIAPILFFPIPSFVYTEFRPCFVQRFFILHMIKWYIKLCFVLKIPPAFGNYQKLYVSETTVAIHSLDYSGGTDIQDKAHLQWNTPRQVRQNVASFIKQPFS